MPLWHISGIFGGPLKLQEKKLTQSFNERTHTSAPTATYAPHGLGLSVDDSLVLPRTITEAAAVRGKERRRIHVPLHNKTHERVVGRMRYTTNHDCLQVSTNQVEMKRKFYCQHKQPKRTIYTFLQHRTSMLYGRCYSTTSIKRV